MSSAPLQFGAPFVFILQSLALENKNPLMFLEIFLWVYINNHFTQVHIRSMLHLEFIMFNATKRRLSC